MIPRLVAARKTPQEMKRIFEDESRTKFVGKADRPLVARLYTEFYNEVVEVEEKRRPCLVRLADFIVGYVGVCLSSILFWTAVALSWVIAFSPFFRANFFFLLMGMFCCFFPLALCVVPSPTFRTFHYSLVAAPLRALGILSRDSASGKRAKRAAQTIPV